MLIRISVVLSMLIVAGVLTVTGGSVTTSNEQATQAATITEIQKPPVIAVDNATNVKNLASFKGPKDNIIGVTFSPDGSILAGIDYSGNIYLWNVQAGTVLNV